jgi:XTP/dITP diphosphohydrolase
MKIILASNNKHKYHEFSEIFKKNNFKNDILIPNDVYLGGFDVEESGLTFEENAMIKAKAFYEAAGMPAIADDSGLEVDALDFRPGVYSARYAGEHGDDKKNRTKVLNELASLVEPLRSARFRCVICYYDGINSITVDGRVEGKIISEERGEGGFGYDPIFIPEGYDETFAEMTQEEKNKISHRARAINKFLEEYQKLNNLQK